MVATREVHADWWQLLRFLPFFPLVGVGLAVNNARGVLEALLGHRTEFVRTPKLGVLGRDAKLVKSRAKTYVGRAGAASSRCSRWGSASTTCTWPSPQLHLPPAGGLLITLVLSAGLFTVGGSHSCARCRTSRRAILEPPGVPHPADGSAGGAGWGRPPSPGRGCAE